CVSRARPSPLNPEQTPMNGQHPLTRREALRAASALGIGGTALTLTTATAMAAQPAKLDAEKIGQAIGGKATTAPDGVVRVAWPRTDVAVMVDGMPLKPFAGLGSWAAFIAAPHGAMVMGDTVVFQDEVTSAMDAAFANNLEVTGLHNHFFYDE